MKSKSKVSVIGLILIGIALIVIMKYSLSSKQKGQKPQKKVSYFTEGIDSIHTDNYANIYLKYYYYIPKTIEENNEKSYPVLIMIPGLSGNGEGFVGQKFKNFADEENFIIIAPSFKWDHENWESKQSYQYPSVWSGTALLEIIDRFKGSKNISISKFYLFGFSAGAQFTLRFCLWWPDLCVACASHSGGGTVIPDYYVDVKFFITIGIGDKSRIRIARTFYNKALEQGIDVIYREYNGGHYLTQTKIDESIEFFKGINHGNGD
jgi:poly(3-hydroxybutyrate) depolymerase